MAVVINDMDLTIEEAIRVARDMEKVEIADDAKERVNKARAYIDKKLDEGAVIYGLTTGFGKFANINISKKDTARLQVNLIRSHTCSLGECFPQKYVRTAMLLRCNALVRGNSGIRLSTIQTERRDPPARPGAGKPRRVGRSGAAFMHRTRPDRRGELRV